MTKEEYIGTLEIRGHKVDIGIDEPGQQYFFEYEEDNKLKTESCGTYESSFIEYICWFFDKKSYYITEYGEDIWDEQIHATERTYQRMVDKYPNDVELKEYYESLLYHMKNDEYIIFDFNALYKELGLR